MQVTIPDVGHYGVEKHKRRCPVCGDMVFSGHRDQCTVCGGSGDIGDRIRSDANNASKTAADQGRDFLMQNLTVDEYSYLQSLIQSMFLTKYVWDDCNVCNGSGKCPQCGGYQNLSIDADVTTLCRLCGGGGLCIRCSGKGFFNERSEPLYSDSKRKKIAENCGVINSLAQKRCAMGISPDDPNSPYLDIDDDGVFHIMERGASSTQGDADYSQDNSYYDDTSYEHQHTNHNSILNVALTIAGILLFVILIIWAKKKISSRRRQ